MMTLSTPQPSSTKRGIINGQEVTIKVYDSIDPEEIDEQRVLFPEGGEMNIESPQEEKEPDLVDIFKELGYE